MHSARITKIPYDSKTAGVEHTPHYLYRQSRHSDQLLSIKTIILVPAKISDVSQGPISHAFLSISDLRLLS